MTTKIEWADDTENVAAGCSEARLPSGNMDPACVHCYARLQSAWCAAMGMALYDGVADRTGNAAAWSGVFRWDRDMLRRKFDRMRGGHRVFLGSMTDLWHPDHDPALLVALAEEIRRLGKRPHEKRPIVITLTKRADRLLAWQREHFPEGLPAWVWPGVTAGCQEAADLRVPVLLQVRAAGPRVVSVEPMTGPVNLDPLTCHRCGTTEIVSSPPAQPWCVECDAEAGSPGWLDGIGWVIAGGESGAKARPSHPDWFRALRDQCVEAGVPFFFKQWGEWTPTGDWYADHPVSLPLCRWTASGWTDDGDADADDPSWVARVGKSAAGRLLDGRTWDEVPDAG